jgi:hypothetical protein
LRLALLQQILNLLLEERILLGGLLGLATGLLGLEACLEFDLHVAGGLAVGHFGGFIESFVLGRYEDCRDGRFRDAERGGLQGK